MAKLELDLERIAKLEDLLGAQLPEILDALVAGIYEQVDRAEEALDSGRPQDAIQPAHRCRNDALMVGAQPMLAALSDLEYGSRGDRLEDAHAAMQRLREVWPETRSEFQSAAHSR